MILEKSEFQRIFSKSGFSLSDEQFEKFSTYSSLLVEWNEKINLTAITDPYGISVKHFEDSVLPLKMLEIPENSSLIDVGTGAGFPSVPMKIIRPDLKITLLDGLNKRVNFLKELCAELSIKADFIHGRAEELGKQAQFREKFDFATARAVASLSELCEYCLPFVSLGGSLIALKGSTGKEEALSAENAAALLGGGPAKISEYSLENGDRRTLIVIKKLSQTSLKYPRNKGQMTKKPL